MLIFSTGCVFVTSKGFRVVFHPVEINFFQVDTPDIAVIHGPVINHSVAGV